MRNWRSRRAAERRCSRLRPCVSTRERARGDFGVESGLGVKDRGPAIRRNPAHRWMELVVLQEIHAGADGKRRWIGVKMAGMEGTRRDETRHTFWSREIRVTNMLCPRFFSLSSLACLDYLRGLDTLDYWTLDSLLLDQPRSCSLGSQCPQPRPPPKSASSPAPPAPSNKCPTFPPTNAPATKTPTASLPTP